MTEHDDVEPIAALAAIEQIQQLKHAYWRACDAKDPQGFRDAFVRTGAKLDYGPLGSFDDVGPMVAIYERVSLRRVDGGGYALVEMHHGFMPEITVLSATEAEGTWSLRYRVVDVEGRTETTSAGVYHDRYTVEDGRWKMSASRFTISWTVTTPLADGAVVTQFLA
jgi:hypothetical protein